MAAFSQAECAQERAQDTILLREQHPLHVDKGTFFNGDDNLGISKHAQRCKGGKFEDNKGLSRKRRGIRDLTLRQFWRTKPTPMG